MQKEKSHTMEAHKHLCVREQKLPVTQPCWQHRTDLAQCFCAHQVHEAHAAHVQDDGVEADVGWSCQHGVGAALQGGAAAAQPPGALPGPSPSGRRVECDVGDAGAVSSGLVVVGVCRGGALKVLLELLQGQGLRQSRGAESGQGTDGSWQVTAPLPMDMEGSNLD